MRVKHTILRTCQRCGTTFLKKPSDVRRGLGLYCSQACYRGTPAERFWSRVNQTEGCWLWTGPTNRGGYGKANLDRHTIGAHRVAWILTYGPIPDGLLVCHHCDNPPCCRPDHLFLGTYLDNYADMIRKGRGTNGVTVPPERRARGVTHARHLHPELSQGENNGRARLTWANVLAIRADYAAGVRKATLARHHHVGWSTIHHVVTDATWQHAD